MERKEVLTFIKYYHRFGGSDYIRGRINGIAYGIGGFDKEVEVANMRVKDGDVLIRKFTEDEYDRFMKEVEKLYPGLCEFNYELKEESE